MEPAVLNAHSDTINAKSATAITGLKASRLFSPLRALGLVTNSVPVAIQARGSDHFVTTSVGDAYHVYNVSLILMGLFKEFKI